MKPIDFKQSTKVLQRPSTLPESKCQSLPVWNDGTQCVSCWNATFAERLAILFTGKVWLGVMSGKSQPPVFVSGTKVFEGTPLKNHILAFSADVKEWLSTAYDNFRNGCGQPDKKKHFIAGFVISAIIGILIAPWLGFALGCIAGIAKEWWDGHGHGTADVMDAIFTFLGAFTALPFTLLFHALT